MMREKAINLAIALIFAFTRKNNETDLRPAKMLVCRSYNHFLIKNEY